MKTRLFGIALAFISLWGFPTLLAAEYEIRSLPYELGFPLFFLAIVALAVGFLVGLALVAGVLVFKDDAA